VKKFLWLPCILSLLGASTFAATLYPAGVKTVAECAFATNPLQQIVTPLGYPPDWRIIVACTDGEWRAMTRHFDTTATDSAFTIRAARLTVINARIFRKEIYSGPEHTLRHELGHIVCNSRSEDIADYFADKGVCRGKSSGR
jgi:hypothetical protein